jgi:hypothetical protein
VGLAVGVVWWLVAPVARLEARGGGVFAVGNSPETSIAADGWFAVCAIVAGVLVAVVGGALLRETRLGVLLGLAVGGIAGSVVAWRLGILLGPPSVEESAAGLSDAARFQGPLELSALGVLLAWSMASSVAFFAAVAGREPGRRADGPAVSEAPVPDLSPSGGSEPSARR